MQCSFSLCKIFFLVSHLVSFFSAQLSTVLLILIPITFSTFTNNLHYGKIDILSNAIILMS